MASDKLADYCREKLAPLGYDNCDVRWNLSHSQGDGVAFYGDVDVLHVARRLFLREGRIREFTLIKNLYKEGNIRVVLTGKDSRCHHAHSMRVDIEELDCGCLTLDDEGQTIQSLQSQYEDAVRALREAIVTDVEQISVRFERVGYALHDRCAYEERVITERRTARFLVQVLELPPNSPDEVFDFSEDGAEIEFEFDALLHQSNQKICTLYARVLDLDSEETMGRGYGSTIMVDADDQTYGGLLPELVRDAIDEVRASSVSDIKPRRGGHAVQPLQLAA